MPDDTIKIHGLGEFCVSIPRNVSADDFDAIKRQIEFRRRMTIADLNRKIALAESGFDSLIEGLDVYVRVEKETGYVQ